MNTRVLIILDNRLFRDCLGLALFQIQSVSVIGIYGRVEEIDIGMMKEVPDVVVLDFEFADRSDLGGIQLLSEWYPEAGILACNVPGSERDVVAFIEAGCRGYVSTDMSLEDLIHGIQSLARGETVCSPRVANLVFSRLSDNFRNGMNGSIPILSSVTPREKDIVMLISKGYGNKEIAERLGIQLQTVKNHVHSILEKLKLTRRTQVATLLCSKGDGGEGILGAGEQNPSK